MNDVPAPRDDAPPPADGRVEMTSDEAVAALLQGKPLAHLRIVRLKLRGEFPLPIDLRGVTLVRPEFDRATFKGGVAMVGCRIDRPRIARCVFEQGWNLGGTTLVRAQIHECKWLGPWRCANLEVLGSLRVGHCHFGDETSFWDAKLCGWTDFVDCEFFGEADFRSFHADEGVVFNGCRFQNEVKFRGSTVTKKFDLGTSSFASLLDLSRAKLHDFAYLEGIQQGPNQSFAFENTVADRIHIRPEQLAGRLKCENERNYYAAMHEWGLIKRIYQNLNRYEEEDWAFYRFKVCQRKAHHRSWWRPWTKVAQFMNWMMLDLGCEYGTNPGRAVRAVTLLTLLFAVIYFLGFDKFHVDHAPIADWPSDHVVNKGIFALMTSLLVFTSGLAGDVMDRAHGWMLLPLAVEATLGTILWGLFIVAFSRKVIR